MNHEEIPASAARTRAAHPSDPSAEQLAVARLERWHQKGNPLLSVEDVRTWLQRSGLVLYAAKPQLGVPAPSFLEATLGQADPAPEMAKQDAAKSLLARLIAEGSAVPLNLLGATGGMGTDQPDFVVSAVVFSYIFTLRGNKAWKQMPVTSGAVKVSPLALAVYELLAAKVTMSAYDLATQLGGGVSEGAVLRALTELWGQLRVLPTPQQDGAAAMWELASGRFTKQIKAGANAGQPSALSALASLYLGQAVAATEDEIESFLSPLAPRSRVRDVVHALLGARQLETLVIEGKTLLHVAGELPVFAASAVAATAATVGDASGEGVGESVEGGPRIRKFAAKPGSKIGTGLRSKPAFGKAAFVSKPAFGRKAEAHTGGERERRPFQRAERGVSDGRGGFDGRSRDRGASEKGPFSKPRFDKPWQEKRPSRDAEGGEGGPARRAFNPREGDGPKRTFSKPGTFGRKREGAGGTSGFEGQRPRRDSPTGGGRPARPARTNGGERPVGAGYKRPGSYTARPSTRKEGSMPTGTTPFRAKPSSAQAKPSRARERGEAGEAPRKVFRKFDAPRSPKPIGSKPAFRPMSTERSAAGERPARTFDGSRGARPVSGGETGFPRKQRTFGEKKTSFGAKKPFVRNGDSGSKGAGGPFAKFADGKKPFRKPGIPKKGSGGSAPTRRKRDGDDRGGERR